MEIKVTSKILFHNHPVLACMHALYIIAYLYIIHLHTFRYSKMSFLTNNEPSTKPKNDKMWQF